MGSGNDINRHKHFHPVTIANIQRLKEVEMERAEILRKVNERRAREKEQRSSEEIQAAVSQARPFKGGPERLDWMYQSGAPPPSPGASAGMACSGVTSSDVAAEPAAPLGLSPQDLLEAGRKRRNAESKLREDPLFEIESKKNEFNLGVAAYLSQIQSEKRARKMEKRVRKLEKKEKKKAEKREKKEKKEKKEKSERKLQKKREKKARKQGSVRMEECEEASQRAPSTSSSVC